MITPAIDARPAQRYHQAAQGEIFGTTRSRLWRDGHFLKGSAVGFGSLATGLGMEGANAGLAAKPEVPAMDAKPDQIGRLVRVVSIGFHPGRPLEEIAALVDAEGAKGADLIAIPETCRGQNETSVEALDGPTVSAMAQLARKHRTYLVCPIDRKEGARRFNSAVLLDRQGQVACVYNKLYPVWQEECLKTPAVSPGDSATVYQADFGRVGLAICFDVNWGSPLGAAFQPGSRDGHLAQRLLRRKIAPGSGN